MWKSWKNPQFGKCEKSVYHFNATNVLWVSSMSFLQTCYYGSNAKSWLLRLLPVIKRKGNGTNLWEIYAGNYTCIFFFFSHFHWVFDRFRCFSVCKWIHIFIFSLRGWFINCVNDNIIAFILTIFFMKGSFFFMKAWSETLEISL